MANEAVLDPADGGEPEHKGRRRVLTATTVAVGAVGAGFCDACLTGEYPVPVPVELKARMHGDVPDKSPIDLEPSPLLDAESLFPADEARNRA